MKEAKDSQYEDHLKDVQAFTDIGKPIEICSECGQDKNLLKKIQRFYFSLTLRNKNEANPHIPR